MPINTKKGRSDKGTLVAGLHVALYSKIEMLKAHVSFQICQNSTVPFANA